MYVLGTLSRLRSVKHMSIKVAAYCRVSTDSTDQANSFENQKSFFEREINKNPDYELYQVYADKGITGTKLQRPEFNHMLEDAGLDIIYVDNLANDSRKQYHKYTTVLSSRQPKFNLILVKNTSRFARNVSVSDILNELKQKGVYVHFLDLNKGTESSADMTYLEIFLSFDEHESRDRSIKVKFGQKESAKRGHIFTSSKLYGYHYIKDTNRCEIIPEEANNIRTIFNLYNQGLGFRQISNYLTEHNITTRNHKPFCKSTLRRIIDNEKYCGLNNSLKYDTGEVFNKNSYPKVKDEYTVQPTDKIPAIVSRDLFNTCQQIMRSKTNYKNQCGIYNGNSKYKNLIYCGVCGSVYHSNRDKGRIFYNCANKKLHGTAACNGVNVSEKQIDAYINWLANDMARVIIHYQNLQYISGMFHIINNLLQKIESNNTDKADKLAAEIKEKQSQLEGYEDIYAMQPNNRDRLKDKITALSGTLDTLQKDYTAETADRESIIEQIMEVFKVQDELKQFELEDKNYTPQGIINILDCIYIMPHDIPMDIYKDNKVAINPIFKFSRKAEEIVKKYDIVEQKPMSKDEVEDILKRIDNVL